MRITTAFIGLLMCMNVMSQPQKSPSLACNLNAISAAERPRYSSLARRLKAAMGERRELANGYAYSIKPSGISLPEVAEWISFERLCCPFLTFQLEVSGHESDWKVQLS